MSRRNPFKRHRIPREIILLMVRWYCRCPLSGLDVQDMLAERGITVDASTVHRWVGKLGPKSGNGPKPVTTLERAAVAGPPCRRCFTHI